MNRLPRKSLRKINMMKNSIHIFSIIMIYLGIATVLEFNYEITSHPLSLIVLVILGGEFPDSNFAAQIWVISLFASIGMTIIYLSMAGNHYKNIKKLKLNEAKKWIKNDRKQTNFLINQDIITTQEDRITLLKKKNNLGVQESTQNCVYCNQELINNQCSECSAMKCRKCGTINMQNSRFCKQCGTFLE
ncbi:MAG: hypothetical protein ACFFCS_10795 [Candidatus Hodarchaeota archaeon]